MSVFAAQVRLQAEGHPQSGAQTPAIKVAQRCRKGKSASLFGSAAHVVAIRASPIACERPISFRIPHVSFRLVIEWQSRCRQTRCR